MEERLKDRIEIIPREYDCEAAARLHASWSDDLMAAFAAQDMTRAGELVESVASNSPYLARLMAGMARAHPNELISVFQNDPRHTLRTQIERVWLAAEEADTEAQARAMRNAKKQAALCLGLSEIAGALTTMEAAALWTDFADAACGAALRAALRPLVRKGFCPLNMVAPEKDCGIAILAMGKMGGRELNYSSDIDLIVLFDPDAPALGLPEEARSLAVAATKGMVARLSDQTADGFVFRTDLRLRPDPGVSAAAVSVNAAEAYYEAHGQNWERAAFIKARAAAGDVKLGTQFLARLRPFIWRKHLDFAAIEDVHSISRQIHAAKGGAEIEFAGHDLKTGRGGIREIEFYVQTQQLILGGKDDDLRVNQTLATLDMLNRKGIVSDEAAAILRASYIYLRQVEHRIQMINDEQTHKVPTQPEMIERLAAFLGEPDVATFRGKVLKTLGQVHTEFAKLFGRENRLSAESGSLSFTGPGVDDGTLETLSGLGFEDAAFVAQTIRRWHFGEYRATRSARARELLTKLTPSLLQSFTEADRPDDAFRAFDRFLQALPGGVQIFSLFANNPQVFNLLILIMTVSPYLGRELADRPNLIESLIEMNWPGRRLSEAEIRASLDDAIDHEIHRAQDLVATSGGAFEAAINAVRRWGGEQKFDIAAQLVVGEIDFLEAATRFTEIADAVIAALLPVAERETARRSGTIDGGMVVLGLGRLGTKRMTAASDIDLIFIYDAAPDAESNGSKPLDATIYFARLVRRLVASFTAPTEEGVLFEVDMALRPSGSAGPVAVSLDAFRKYYDSDAWTWERMALVKARLIAGDAALGDKVTREIGTIIGRKMPATQIASDIDEMRERLLSAKPPRSVWDLKLTRGGFAEIDFIHGYLALAGLTLTDALAEDELALMQSAETLFETVLQFSRAAIGESIDPTTGGRAVEARLCALLGVKSLAEAEAQLDAVTQKIRALYEKLLGVSPPETLPS